MSSKGILAEDLLGCFWNDSRSS